MSGVRDNWERLVEAVLDKEELKQLAYCESSSSVSICSRSSFDSSLEDPADGNSAVGAVAGEKSTAVGNSAAGAIGGVFAAASARLLTAPAVALARYRRRKPLQDHFFHIQLGRLRRFSLPELQRATDNFSTKNFLGSGGFSLVYKGQLADGSLVAVRRLAIERGEDQFQVEVEAFRMATHRNIRRLLGFCRTPKERLLVYPLMVNGSVASCLRGRLDWPIRQRIALGSARGLAYLHDQCDPKIIHRDVKVDTIFLDEDFEAVVGGFWLALLMDCRDTHVATTVCGTIGHIAPEYLSAGICSEKTDIFSYGVMLLELITGQRASDHSRLSDGVMFTLLNWVKECLRNNNLEELVDAGLEGNYVEEEVNQLIQVALLCTRSSPMERPKMSEVIRMLEDNQMRHVHTDWTIGSTSDIESNEFLDPR